MSSNIFGQPSFNPKRSEISVSEVENFKLFKFEIREEALNFATYFKDLHGYLSSCLNFTRFFS